MTSLVKFFLQKKLENISLNTLQLAFRSLLCSKEWTSLLFILAHIWIGLDLKLQDRGKNYWCPEPHLSHELSSDQFISSKLIDVIQQHLPLIKETLRSLYCSYPLFLWWKVVTYQKNYDYIFQWNFGKFLTSNMRFQRNFMFVASCFGKIWELTLQISRDIWAEKL